jgi:CO dehydrogenase/acetyl-CoA synthase epsilon subunit
MNFDATIFTGHYTFCIAQVLQKMSEYKPVK